jgi:4'-phosphopantetheinyl transferase EntD
MPEVCRGLSEALMRLRPPGVLIDHRLISEGDEDALFPAETLALGASVLKVRRQSGAARIAARRILRELGVHDAPVPRSKSGAPIWPTGFVGSIAHDDRIAVAAVASTVRFLGLGVDIEPAERLPPELVEMIATSSEREQYAANIVQSRLLFVIKEAVYKATNPLDGIFLNFHDIAVDLTTNQATILNMRKVNFAVCTAPYVVALAYLEKP